MQDAATRVDAVSLSRNVHYWRHHDAPTVGLALEPAACGACSSFGGRSPGVHFRALLLVDSGL